MKKVSLAFIVVATALLLSSCGHNISNIGFGTGWRVGNGEYGFAYGEGLMGTFVTKDGVKFKAEIDSNTGLTYDPTSHTYKGIKSVEYSLPPQITGYAVDFAKENPEVAKLYYDALIKFYETQKEIATSPESKPLISDDKSKTAAQATVEIIKAVIEKYQKEKEAAEPAKEEEKKEEEKKDDESVSSSESEETTPGKTKPVSDVFVPSKGAKK